MKLTQNKTKVVETKVVVEHACDLCGLKNEKPESGHWSPETTYSINRVTIEHVTGAVYPRVPSPPPPPASTSVRAVSTTHSLLSWRARVPSP